MHMTLQYLNPDDAPLRKIGATSSALAANPLAVHVSAGNLFR